MDEPVIVTMTTEDVSEVSDLLNIVHSLAELPKLKYIRAAAEARLEEINDEYSPELAEVKIAEANEDDYEDPPIEPVTIPVVAGRPRADVTPTTVRRTR